MYKHKSMEKEQSLLYENSQSELVLWIIGSSFLAT